MANISDRMDKDSQSSATAASNPFASNVSLMPGVNGNQLLNYLAASGGGTGLQPSSAQDLAMGQQAQAIVNAAAAAAVAAGSLPAGAMNTNGTLRRSQMALNEDMLWMPPHRPLVGGGAAAAYEALRHDHYVRQHAERQQRQLQEQQVLAFAERQNAEAPSSGNQQAEQQRQYLRALVERQNAEAPFSGSRSAENLLSNESNGYSSIPTQQANLAASNPRQ
jgi:hypothetical protein